MTGKHVIIRLLLLGVCCLGMLRSQGQDLAPALPCQSLALQDLSHFKPSRKRHWQLAGSVFADRKVKLWVSGLREGYIHELKVSGLHNHQGAELLHPVAYYTLNALPGGAPSRQKIPPPSRPTGRMDPMW
jgi:hypothetical protein